MRLTGAQIIPPARGRTREPSPSISRAGGGQPPSRQRQHVEQSSHPDSGWSSYLPGSKQQHTMTKRAAKHPAVGTTTSNRIRTWHTSTCKD